MRAHAQLAVAADAHRRSRIAKLRSDAPLVLRPTFSARTAVPGWPAPDAAAVSLAAAAAGPLGGDRLRMDVEVGAGAGLVLRTVAATLVLPGPHGRPSHSETNIRIGRGATLIWLPEPVIAARGCDHHGTTRIDLEQDARLITREELILGRYAEDPGAVRQRLRVSVDGRPLHDQQLCVGPDERGWRSPAVTGGRTAIGNLLVVSPARDPASSGHGTDDAGTDDAGSDAATLRLNESATLVTALAHDALALRQSLERHMPCAASLASSDQPAATMDAKRPSA